MALHDVAAEAVAGAQRQLEVDAVAGRDAGQRGAAQRLVHHVGRERRRRDRGGGQADAVDRDRVALGSSPASAVSTVTPRAVVGRGRRADDPSRDPGRGR